MASSDTVFAHITQLVNDRVRSDKRSGGLAFTQEAIVEHLELGSLSVLMLKKLVNVLMEECDIYIMTENESYSGTQEHFDYSSMTTTNKNLMSIGYLSVDFMPKRHGSESPPRLDAVKNGFRQLVMTSSLPNGEKYIPVHQRNTIDIFVNFHIDKIAKDNLILVPELDLMKAVCHGVYEGLQLTSVSKTSPAKPPHRKDVNNNDVWCQMRYDFFNNSVSKKAVDLAVEAMGAKPMEGRLIKLLFAIKDSVEENNEWGSCPLLHVGTNFKTEKLSQSVYDNIHNYYTDKENVLQYEYKDAGC